MIRILYSLFIIILVFCTGCMQFEPVKTWKVNYRVYKLSNDSISYRVNFTTQSGATKSVGPISDFKWESEDLNNFEDGAYVMLEVENIWGDEGLRLQILREDAVHEEGFKPKYDTYYQIESNL